MTTLPEARRARARATQVASTLVLFGAAVLATACDYNASETPRLVTTVSLDVADTTIEVGQATEVTAIALDQYGDSIASSPASYASSAPEIAAVSPTLGTILAISAGTARIDATIESKSAHLTLTVVQAAIRINEIRPNGDIPGGWVELFNPTATAVDMSGWTITSGDVSHGFEFPSGASIPASGYLVIAEQILPLGLKAVDAVHLFSRFGVQADSYSWTANPLTSFGRCPDGTGAFVTTAAATRKATNVCPAVDP
jgi:hypothetical protein